MEEYSKIAGLSWPKHKRIVRAHYTMDQRLGTVVLDESGNNLNGSLKGNPQWVQVHISVYFHNFYLFMHKPCLVPRRCVVLWLARPLRGPRGSI